MDSFKLIKSIDNFSNYEMSQDGKSIRHTKTLAAIPLVLSGTKVKAELVSDDGKEKKSFGVKTLYWSSWNKPLPVDGEASASDAKKVTARAAVSSSKPSDKQLISNKLRGEVINLIEKRLAKKGTASGQQVEDNSLTMRILVHNVEKKMLLVRLYTSSWRDGFWFFEPDSGKYSPFIKEKHKPAHGDSAIIWPTY